MYLRGVCEMNHFVVTLLSAKPCELNRFLSQFSNQKIHTEEGTFRWSSPTLTALDCSLILSTLLDNDEKYQIEAYLSINHHQIQVNQHNIDDMIKLLCLS